MRFSRSALIPGRCKTSVSPVGRSLNGRISVGFAAAVFMLCAIGIISCKSISQLISDARWSARTYQTIAEINLLRARIKDAESSTRGYVISGEPQYLNAFQTAVDGIPLSIQTLRATAHDNTAEQSRLDQLQPLLRQKLQIVHRQVQLRGTYPSELPEQSALAIEGTKVMDQMSPILQEMEDQEKGLLTLHLNATEASAKRSILLIVGGSVTALALVALAGGLIRKDIAGRTRAERALQASESLFRGLLESAPDAIVIVNEKGDIEIFSKQAEQMFGYSADDVRGKPIETLIPQRYHAGHIAKRDAYFEAPLVRGMGVGHDLYGVRKDGQEFPVEISLSPMRTPTGLRVSSAIRDITRRKQDEQALTSLNDDLRAKSTQLETAYKELESFSYSVSHDLRTPLRSLDGFSQALLEDYSGKLDDEGRNFLQRIRAASQRMGQLIDDLLNLSKVTLASMAREKVDLSKMAREVFETLHNADPERDVEFVVADGLLDQADSHLLRIVMLNLLGNAWKFTAKSPHARIEFGRSGTNGNSSYFVRDNGAGFDMKYAGKLFGAFQRLHAATDFPGTGIGLATVQRIVQRHSGRIWATGQVNEGATFHFTL